LRTLIETRLNALKLNESVNPRKGCLGRLEGVCADYRNPTRNGRLYTRKLWENVFNDPIFQESLESKTLLGELDHPEDRLEVLAGEACIVMTDYHFDDDEGVVYAGFDILDTPRGKILKTLLDYGCVMGVSSRGQGDITNTSEGETVDEDTYDFACFDVVTTPAVEKARQNVVESVNKTKRFVESIKKQIKEAETIGDLNAIKRVVKVTQSPEIDSILESIEDKCSSIKEGKTITSNNDVEPQNLTETVNKTDSTKEQPHDSSAKTISEHREMIRCINSMRKQISAYKYRESRMLETIQCKCQALEDTKEQLDSISNTNKQLQRENRRLKSNAKIRTDKFHESLSNQHDRVSALEESLMTKDSTVSKLQQSIAEYKKANKGLERELKMKENTIQRLSESASKAERKISNLSDNIDELKLGLSEKDELIDRLSESNAKLESDSTYLNEQITALHSDISLTESQAVKDSRRMESEINQYSSLVDDLHEQVNTLKSQLSESNANSSSLNKRLHHLAEQLNQYQLNYINTKSRQLGIDANLVKKFVNVGTTVEQIDKLVEDIQGTKDRYAKLPISESMPKGVTLDSVLVEKPSDEDERLISFCEQIAKTNV
jgi:chromosome segregation ATPase